MTLAGLLPPMCDVDPKDDTASLLSLRRCLVVWMWTLV